jgi:hypothetical protein
MHGRTIKSQNAKVPSAGPRLVQAKSKDERYEDLTEISGTNLVANRIFKNMYSTKHDQNWIYLKHQDSDHSSKYTVCLYIYAHMRPSPFKANLCMACDAFKFSAFLNYRPLG